MNPKNRNPLIIPEREARGTTRCSSCGGTEFTRRRVQGVIIGHCKKCGAEIQGGLPQMPQDPRVPHPAESYIPTVQFLRGTKGDEPVELRRRVDSTPEHRKGAPILEPGEEP